MGYKELNKEQRDRMNGICSQKYEMSWADPKLMDYLMGELPKIRRFRSDKDIENEVASLEKVLSTYDAFFTDKTDFLEKISKSILEITKAKEYWCGLNVFEVERNIKIHSFCLISGEGGIGKSYFIKCFEEELEKKKIPHLCLYGKFEKNTDKINVEEIIKASTNGFIFIVDAINEMSKEGQNKLLEILSEFKKNPRIRILLSYRTNTMDKDILKRFQMISEYEYKFEGVSFESALSELLRMSIPDIYLYEDILYSNNALWLSMLCEVLSSEKLVDETQNGILTITYILEQYIKKTIDKTFKGNLACKGKDIWKDTKRIAEWMYVNEKREIDEKSLLKTIKTGTDFLKSMIQMDFINMYEINDEKYYYFVIDSLTDFLIARSLFADISGKECDECVDIIKSKIENLYGLKEAFIIAIFDCFSKDYIKIKNILKETGLLEDFDYNTIIKIHFNNEDIGNFQSLFKPENNGLLLKIIGGYTYKPFNCSNYLFDFYCANSENIRELSYILEGYHFQNDIKKRLKNMLYFITINDTPNRRDEEALYFSLLCCAAPNKEVRCLAVKLLYEVVSKNEVYVDKIILAYYKIIDFYVKESIIYVLSQLQKNNGKINEFFNGIVKKDDNLTAKSIRRISTYLGNPYSYINWKRKNLFVKSTITSVSDYLNDILFIVDIMDKSYLPFRYWGKDHIDMHAQFLINDKVEIESVNNYLSEKYSCVCGGECSGSMVFEKKVMPEIKQITEIETMNIYSFLKNLENVFRMIFKFYGIVADKKSWKIREEDFPHSVFMKCVDIGVGLYYGSLMTNYYTNEFATFNTYQNSIGYEIYDPLENGEKIIVTSPIPTYQDFIEKLGDYVINLLERPLIYDKNWVNDVVLVRRNVLHLLETIKVKGKEWVLLAGRVSLNKRDEYELKWRDTYEIWCCTSEKETIKNDGLARYLTIELEEYWGDMKSYSENTYKPWLCKEVKDINNDSEVFESTSLVLPPSEIISFFNLNLNISDMSWENQEKEKIIICNNNKNAYYIDPVGGTVFMRKDYYDKYAEGKNVKYFAYTERCIPETGYADDTSLHFEIINGKIEKEIKNSDVHFERDSEINPICYSCPYTNISGTKNEISNASIELINNILVEYGINDDAEFDDNC